MHSFCGDVSKTCLFVQTERSSRLQKPTIKLLFRFIKIRQKTFLGGGRENELVNSPTTAAFAAFSKAAQSGESPSISRFMSRDIICIFHSLWTCLFNDCFWPVTDMQSFRYWIEQWCFAKAAGGIVGKIGCLASRTRDIVGFCRSIFETHVDDEPHDICRDQ